MRGSRYFFSFFFFLFFIKKLVVKPNHDYQFKEKKKNHRRIDGTKNNERCSLKTQVYSESRVTALQESCHTRVQVNSITHRGRAGLKYIILRFVRVKEHVLSGRYDYEYTSSYVNGTFERLPEVLKLQ